MSSSSIHEDDERTVNDVEMKTPPPLELNREKQNSDVLLVDWDGPDDPHNPKNWSEKKKWISTVIVSAFTFVSPVSSSMVAPASAKIASEFGITSSVEVALTISVFVLAFAIGPLFLGPLSEIFGRVRIIQGSNIFFFVWNLCCGFAQDKSQLIIFRFFAGIGGSAPLAVGGGVLGDIWRPEERGKAIAIYSLAPLLGPVIGPVAGAWIAERTTWRWVFYSTSILTMLVQALGLLYLRESFAPFILGRRAKEIQASLDGEKGDKRVVRSVFESEDRSWNLLMSKALIRPFALFVQEPIIQVIGAYMALTYGIFYLFLTTIPSIFSETGVYKESTGIAGLHYIPLGLGMTIASQINARTLDKVYIYLKNRNEGVGQPEFRVPSMIPGSILLPAGLFLAGWATERHLHWIATDFGIAFIGAGMILGFQGMQTYIVDAFSLHAASALAAVSCLRSLAGFGFPLFAPTMYERIGYGKGNTILACAAIIIGIPAPFLFWKYGKTLRMRSKYAKRQ